MSEEIVNNQIIDGAWLNENYKVYLKELFNITPKVVKNEDGVEEEIRVSITIDENYKAYLNNWFNEHYHYISEYLNKYHQGEDIEELTLVLHDSMIESFFRCNNLVCGFIGNGSYFYKAFKTDINRYYSRKKRAEPIYIPKRSTSKKDMKKMKERSKYNPKFNSLHKSTCTGYNEISNLPDTDIPKDVIPVDIDRLNQLIDNLVSVSKLSNRESEVVSLKRTGLTVTEVATKLGIRKQEVQVYTDRARAKFARHLKVMIAKQLDYEAEYIYDYVQTL